MLGLSDLPELSDLRLDGVPCQEHGWPVRCLPRMTRLTRLDLQGTRADAADGRRQSGLSPAAPTCIVLRRPAAFARLSAVQHLNLANNSLGAEHVAPVATWLSALTGLVSLDMSDNPALGGGDLRKLMHHLAPLTTLRDVRLAACGLTASMDAAAAVSLLTALTALDLSRNELPSRGVAAAAALPALRRLRLSAARLAYPAAAAIAAAVATGRPLAALDVSGNSLNASAAVTLCAALAGLTDLRRLDVSHNPLGDQGAATVSQQLLALPELTHLGMASVALGAAAAAALADTLPQLPCLEDLRLNDNPVGEAGAAALVAALPRLPRLRAASLRRLRGVDDSAEARAARLAELCAVWAQLPRLTRLDVDPPH